MTPHVLTLALAAALPLAASCQSSGADKAQATVESTSKLEAELRNADAQTGTTLAALDMIVAEPEGDLRPAFDAYSKSLSILQSAAKSVGKEGANVRSKAKAYYADWEATQATITNPDIRKRSEERRMEMLKKQEEVNAWVVSFGQDFDGFVSELGDIRAFLETDLNSAGVKAISGQVKNTTKTGQDLRERIGKLVAALEEVRKSTSARGPAAPPQESK